NVLNQMVRHATEPPRPVKELRAEVPDGLQQVLNYMLAKDPKQRYPTPERAAGSLQMFMVAGAPVRNIDESPVMKKYLTCLEMGDPDEKPAPKTPPPKKPTPVPNPPASGSFPSLPKKNIPPGKTNTKHHKKHKKERQRKSVPRAQPAGAPPDLAN